jgi:glycosyltransferase involved in cell wall biosynthesis
MSNLLGVPAARLAGVPVIISSRRYLADFDWWQSPLRLKLLRLAYRSSTQVVVNSTSIRELLVTREHISPTKVCVIPNGVDVDKFTAAAPDRKRRLPAVGRESKLIAVVANMFPVKGHASLVVAAKTICRDYPNAIFLLIGDGQERPKLERQVKEMGLEPNFLFLGARKDVPELLACCDLSVLPSESEGLPNSVLEAMAAGLAVVATSVGGVPELIENEVSGLLVPPNNPSALSTAILRLLQDESLRQRLSSAGRDCVVTRFSFLRLVETLETLYSKVPEPVPFRREMPAAFEG